MSFPVTELLLLHLILCFVFVLAPLMTKMFFLSDSKIYSDAHKASLLMLLVDFAFSLGGQLFAVFWLLFCAAGVFILLKREYKSLHSLTGLALYIPFIFSVISAIWFVAGVYDLHLLGYNRAWSFYAALHGGVLGWAFVGCLAFLSKQTRSKNIYLLGCYVCLLCFLLVAFGINGIPYIKRMGLTGFSIAVPLTIGVYAMNIKRENRVAVLLASLSVISVVLSMLMAVFHEFWLGFPKLVLGIPLMVLVHGVLNAFIAVPCFALAIKYGHAGKVRRKEFQDTVVFFDGLCVLCSGTVKLLLRLDKKRVLKYSSLQGQLAQKILQPQQNRSYSSVVLRDEDVFYDRAEAVICILKKLGGLYKCVGMALGVFPLFLLNWAYDFIARNRHRIFGTNEVCFIPTAEYKDLMIP